MPSWNVQGQLYLHVNEIEFHVYSVLQIMRFWSQNYQGQVQNFWYNTLCTFLLWFLMPLILPKKIILWSMKACECFCTRNIWDQLFCLWFPSLTPTQVCRATDSYHHRLGRIQSCHGPVCLHYLLILTAIVVAGMHETQVLGWQDG